MSFPKELKYTKDHEWILVKGEVATLGITGFALNQMGDIVFVELPEVDSSYEKGDSIGTIESTKTVSDIFTPLSGAVLEVNNSVADNLELLTQDPYDRGWLVKLSAKDVSLEDLMSAEEYASYTAEL